jgi:hypothetical protein
VEINYLNKGRQAIHQPDGIRISNYVTTSKIITNQCLFTYLISLRDQPFKNVTTFRIPIPVLKKFEKQWKGKDPFWGEKCYLGIRLGKLVSDLNMTPAGFKSAKDAEAILH